MCCHLFPTILTPSAGFNVNGTRLLCREMVRSYQVVVHNVLLTDQQIEGTMKLGSPGYSVPRSGRSMYVLFCRR